jgi:uptake hydrogenase large subunit
MDKRTITMEMNLNRVEGDLEIKLQVEDNTVTDAWCIGRMYRGYEQILVGRDPNDALVITPRICGICSTSQLYAATSALEVAYQSPIAPNGTRIRNLCLMAESVMSDTRHAFLMFAPDLCNKAYEGHALYDRILEAFEPPFRGEIARQTVRESKKILGIIIAFGGQWPHSSYMMVGGVTINLNRSTLLDCLNIIDEHTQWYEKAILGCSSERWLELENTEDVDRWLDEDRAHRDSAVGLFIRFGRSIGLHRTGKGAPNLLSSGCYYDPESWRPPFDERRCLMPAGFYDGETNKFEPFSHTCIAEHVRHSWFIDPGGERHPWDSETEPDYRSDGPQYTYGKAPRYDGRVVQLGPLSDLVIAGDRLLTSFFKSEGPNTWLRQFARFHRPVLVLGAMRRTVTELMERLGEPTRIKSEARSNADGYGLINAARGSLGHWVKVREGKIANYQVITPTTWNGSPRDSSGTRGHWEESFIGLEIKDLDNPVELHHVVRSHDACLVCTVHYLTTGKRRSFPLW